MRRGLTAGFQWLAQASPIRTCFGCMSIRLSLKLFIDFVLKSYRLKTVFLKNNFYSFKEHFLFLPKVFIQQECPFLPVVICDR